MFLCIVFSVDLTLMFCLLSSIIYSSRPLTYHFMLSEFLFFSRLGIGLCYLLLGGRYTFINAEIWEDLRKLITICMGYLLVVFISTEFLVSFWHLDFGV